MDNKQFAAVGIGAGIGTAQTWVLREYIDPTYGAVIPQIGGWGTLSSIFGWGLGGILTVLGIAGYYNKGPVRSDVATSGLVSYGVPALIGGICSGIWPVAPPLRAVAPRMVRPTATTTVRPTVANSLRTVATTQSTVRA